MKRAQGDISSLRYTTNTLIPPLEKPLLSFTLYTYKVRSGVVLELVIQSLKVTFPSGLDQVC
ncbi:hypothetical protein [Photobacterium jeanii]|uniref:hypothetical protein n=1 Tax=Photobacterium jeanii TaxID=858640 RepID=UPI000B20E7FF|nr:hypothetical protein [Photobacterium jeanii]